jgi:imidazoleglycerol-phosphate dehydratase
MNERKCTTERKTKETRVRIELNIDGKGSAEANTGIKFLNHLLVTLAKHSSFDLRVEATGDLAHHVVEDVGIVLGEALLSALGDKKGIKRFGFSYVTMDDSLSRAVVDLGGRPYYVADLNLQQNKIEDVMSEDIEHFLMSFALASKINVHVAVLYGKNDHHKIESTTKALALALREAASQDPRLDSVPSAKGVL